ncbi:MAG TPA: L,D-transpeptidase family protein [Croceibacterium sp.]|nr:L,D-transpeptidase family protein [Croceibacterium sp.]
MLLAACGFNGTDRYDEEETAEKAATPAPQPVGERFEEVSLTDSEPRPMMQLQVVLDRQGFGPGVIDGREGLSTTNALKGFQEANGLEVTGELDLATRGALAQWDHVAATRVVRIPESWGRETYHDVPDEPADQAKLDRLGYESIDERLAERFHTTPEVLRALNPGGRPAQAAAASATPAPAAAPSPTTPDAAAAPAFRAGQLVRVPNAGVEAIRAGSDDKPDWLRTLASLGVDATQPGAARVVVDKSEGSLKAYDRAGKLLAMFTVTSGSSHDPLPLGDWKVLGVSKNPPFHYNPDLFWDADASDEKATLPPGPNGPVGVVWIDLSKEHYGIHGTPEPQTIGRSQSHGCVRLTNWDAARLAGMVDGSTEVVFEA